MLSANTEEYLDNWNKKVDLIIGDDLRHVFERFNSLYKIYGRLCNEAILELINNGLLTHGGGDQRNVTNNVIHYITANAIIDGFRINNNEQDIRALISVMPHFKIKFTPNGQHESNVDIQLIQDLQSESSVVKAVAILQIIYFVRCNYEHSRKDFQEYQRLLLEPLINLLRSLNNLLFSKLKK
jgi:hypothetical protein